MGQVDTNEHLNYIYFMPEGLSLSESDMHVGGIAVSTESHTKPGEGLSLNPADAAKLEAGQRPFDIHDLLEKDGMSVDAFFALDRDAVYNQARQLITLQDQAIVEKAQRIMDRITEGREEFERRNPGKTEVEFADNKPTP